MKKLQITGEAPPVPEDVEAYIETLRRGLTDEQVQLIDELFVDYVPAEAELDPSDRGS